MDRQLWIDDSHGYALSTTSAAIGTIYGLAHYATYSLNIADARSRGLLCKQIGRYVALGIYLYITDAIPRGVHYDPMRKSTALGPNGTPEMLTERLHLEGSIELPYPTNGRSIPESLEHRQTR